MNFPCHIFTNFDIHANLVDISGSSTIISFELAFLCLHESIVNLILVMSFCISVHSFVLSVVVVGVVLVIGIFLLNKATCLVETYFHSKFYDDGFLVATLALHLLVI